MKLTLVERIRETDSVESFIWEPDGELTWTPGQYLTYKFPHTDMDDRGDTRWFTIASTPAEGVVRLTTRLDATRPSSFKRELFKLQPGATIEAEAPEGDFTYDGSRPVVMLAGGIGITPFRAILKSLVAQGKTIHGGLLYGNRDDQFIFDEELHELAVKLGDFKIVPVVAPSVISMTDVKTLAANLTAPLIYVSGPESMVKAYKEQLLLAGYLETDIKLDDFPNYTEI